MEKKIRNIETVSEYNDMLGVETLHPLVSVINLSQARMLRHARQTFSFAQAGLRRQLSFLSVNIR